MAKRYRDENSHIEALEKEIKKLKQINGELKRKVKEEKKYVNTKLVKESLPQTPREKILNSDREICPKCNNGEMLPVEVAGRIFHRCVNCNNRTPAKKCKNAKKKKSY